MADPPTAEGSLVIGTAGHVDHGKTTLVGALTGRDTDRLAAEKERGISIELGFAPLVLPSGRRLSLVDVPGHERFVRHMVAGAGGIDAYLLCVAADDGVMPQTREHMAVLDLLGVADGVVAVTRSDLTDPSPAAAAVRELVGARVEVVPVSAPRGDGIDDLVGALERLGARMARRPAEGAARLFVDRAFSAPGAGTVVTGTLWGAALTVGDRVRVGPGEARGRIRSMQIHDLAVDAAGSGRVALNLAGVERGSAPRGSCVVRDQDQWRATSLLDVGLRWLNEAGGPLRTRRDLRAFLGTAEVTARCVLLEDDAVEPGGHGYAQLRLERPVFAAAGDRLILRSAEPRTVGGATVIDPAPARHGRGARAGARLRVLQRGEPGELAALRLREAGAMGLPAGTDGLELAEVRIVGGVALAPDVADRGRAALLDAVAAGPLSVAAARAASGLGAEAAAALLARLIDEGVLTRRGAWIGLPGAEAPTPGADAVADLLAAAALRPPTEPDLARAAGLPPDACRAALMALRGEGRVVSGGELWFDAAAAADARRRAVAALSERGPLTLGELRDLWAVGRRQALALAAHLDSEGVTRRVGDRRALRRAAALRGSPSSGEV